MDNLIKFLIVLLIMAYVLLISFTIGYQEGIDSLIEVPIEECEKSLARDKYCDYIIETFVRKGSNNG